MVSWIEIILPSNHNYATCSFFNNFSSHFLYFCPNYFSHDFFFFPPLLLCWVGVHVLAKISKGILDNIHSGPPSHSLCCCHQFFFVSLGFCYFVLIYSRMKTWFKMNIFVVLGNIVLGGDIAQC
jgi:hypothetical protein